MLGSGDRTVNKQSSPPPSWCGGGEGQGVTGHRRQAGSRRSECRPAQEPVGAPTSASLLGPQHVVIRDEPHQHVGPPGASADGRLPRLRGPGPAASWVPGPRPAQREDAVVTPEHFPPCLPLRRPPGVRRLLAFLQGNIETFKFELCKQKPGKHKDVQRYRSAIANTPEPRPPSELRLSWEGGQGKAQRCAHPPTPRGLRAWGGP